ncbi:hypothetical protein SAMN02745866_02519 [Alteromonadaceae bacterium Bs31]|nr:hypothetical protein SAMN02745866_02519 [Alteromonadaceae bacterium Bs31]
MKVDQKQSRYRLGTDAKDPQLSAGEWGERGDTIFPRSGWQN